MTRLLRAGGLMAMLLVAAPWAHAANEAGLNGQPTWRAATSDEALAQLREWFDARGTAAELRQQAEASWQASATAGGDLLDRLASAMALGDERIAALVGATQLPDASFHLPDVTWIQEPDTAAFARDNLRLWYGRWLAQREFYDEAAALLTDLEPQAVLDPATLLFYQAVAHHQLLAKAPGLKAIDALLHEVINPPRRYLKLAELLRADFDALEDESLDHIARRMANIERHLGLRRADQKVRDIEDGVIASLDKLIKQLEEQAKNAAQSAGQGGGQSGPAQGIKPGGQPAEQSTPAGGRGAGDVDQRDLGNEDGWGNLPPKQREEALQQIGQDFPAHYRDVIEQYFRKLADEGREN